MTHADDLRAWARGSYDLEAATELLIRAFNGRYARPGTPWVKEESGRPWIDFDSIPDHLGGSSGGERRFLLLVASLASDVQVALGEAVSGLDGQHLDLVLAGIAHAGGSHQHSDRLGSLHPWPLALDDL